MVTEIFFFSQQGIFEYNPFESESNMIPTFQIVHSRKFELSELCELFVGRWLKYVYLIVLLAYTFLSCLSYATVAGSAWAVNLPLNFGKCNSSQFLNEVLPAEISCRNAYQFCLFLFACIVIPLSVIELKEQTIVQVILGMLRFITIGVVVLFSISNFMPHEDICSCDQPWLMNNSMTLDEYADDQCSMNTTRSNMVNRFVAQKWLLAIPVFVYAHVLHQGIPALIHPVKQKQYLRAYFTTLFVVVGVLYMLLGVTTSLWWRDCINETCTLNWVSVSQQI